MKLEKDRSLPFLDTLLTRREDGSLDIKVYHKTTHTDRYLQYASHNPLHVKRGVTACLSGADPEINYDGLVGVHKSMNIITKGERVCTRV